MANNEQLRQQSQPKTQWLNDTDESEATDVQQGDWLEASQEAIDDAADAAGK